MVVIGASKSAELEHILCDPGHSFRWFTHDYPYRLACWNYHPEYEIHLITQSSGTAFVGDYIGDFHPGNLCLVGSNLPHEWVSTNFGNQTLSGRDMVLQFDPQIFARAAGTMPEMAAPRALLEQALRGLQFHGRAEKQGIDLMRRIGAAQGLQRFALFLELIALMSETDEKTVLSSHDYAPNLDPGSAAVMQRVTAYILGNITDEVRMSVAAELAEMTPSTFSRYFKRTTGKNFVDYVHKLRIGRACNMINELDEPITSVCFNVGYKNISNFNRHFKRECGLTPSGYRKLAGVPRSNRI
ncbi:AraC family transcriptional regulator [Phyllobacterium myrsinacearum]|jgi:AraC-like DNA-binding protein|uniref:AraC family transcriptional regulator n=1 Tax=Phyllobacterium myrsinacearum TaxID=28101 RepID=A0A2S9JFM3_9HYPH|nr:AraC family transcriptional regulator [Phyllobacterium myrsinacearum]PRD51728.1 AraC family transcriptional regulator [Phyllobacterium myrsinacearum]PWV86287.1 AraC family transcriptional regulator [Phyllobacterium myrsinacearum]RZV00012.1 AraC family transcriptional regulator [Phyllobacterium myrsinacearum]